MEGWGKAARELGLRLGRGLGACALAVGFAHAAPAPGTPITNQASANLQYNGAPVSVPSNVVTAIASSVDPASYSATLASSSQVVSRAGATLDFRHVLTNTGLRPDAYTLALASVDGGDLLASFTMFADANGDGAPDSATPLSGPVALAPGQAFRFVVRVQVAPFAPAGRASGVNVTATSANRAVIAPNRDAVVIERQFGPADCASVAKWISVERGPSPGGPVTISLDYKACGVARSKAVITDPLPAGMRYVPGSGRWSGAGEAALSDAILADDRQGSGTSRIEYDFGATTAGAVTATVHNIPADGTGRVTFQVTIDAGLAVDARIDNRASAAFFDMAGVRGYTQDSNVASYTVTGRIDLELTGERLPSAQPGSTVSFDNVLTNKGDIAETFDITYGASTFPAGTTFALFKSDGLTPLADTDGNGTPDTGVVAAGASYRIVLKATIPATAAPAAYKVTKTARSARVPARSASADDAVETIATRCDVALDNDQQARIGRGQRVTYPHYLTNRGNCSESVRATVEYLSNSLPGWTATAWIDNKSGGGGSMPGAVDPTDTQVVPGWNATLAPGETLRILVEVRSPALAAKADESNLTTLVISSSGSGGLTVRDTTLVDDKDDPVAPANVLRNFVDHTYTYPTIWAVVGMPLWLRADAASCNADDAVVERRRIVLTGPDGEREEVIATETGPATGVFLAPALAVRNPPVAAGSGAVEGRPDDVFTAEIVGCGRRIETQVTIRSAFGIVFDSLANEPVEGAVVTLTGASGGQCATAALELGSGSNPARTGSDGAFRFPALGAGEYCVRVQAPNGYRFASQVPWTRLAAGRNLHVTGPTRGGSYGTPFALAAGGFVTFDVPVDPVAQDGLFVQKEASRQVVELGEFLDYTVRIGNNTGNALSRADVLATDELPAGFAYVPGSTRLEGRAIADPAVQGGSRLVFNVGRMERGAEVALTYRVRVGAGALPGDATNRVQASYTANGQATRSNTAAVKVQVSGGVFGDKGFILGKVFLDCDANGVQDRGEPGVAGVRMVLEDGTFAITDGEGKYSFYGISNRTHVVKADRTSLLRGGRLAPISQRHLGDGGSRIVDLKSGEMHRADFAFAGCEAGLREQARQRSEELARREDALSSLASAQLATERVALADVKALPASGTVQVQQNAGTVSPSPLGEGRGEGPRDSTAHTTPTPPRPTAAAEVPELEKLLPEADNTLAFVGLEEGQAVASTQPPIRVKGAAGATFELSVNGKAVAATHVGKRATLAEKKVQAWEFFGVDLHEGDNRIAVVQRDAFGNERGRREITVRAPGRLAKVEVAGPAGGGIADGKSAALVTVRLRDAKGLPFAARTVVTLDSSRGTWGTADIDPVEPGLQAVVEGGEGVVHLMAPTEPGEARVVVGAGTFRAETRVDFLPELRSLIAAGVVEGIIDLRKLDPKALVPARGDDGFEQELRHFSRTSGDGKRSAGARAAFFLKGKVRGGFLLTAAYDSDKDTKERLFRDIQPDEFYPVYGDAAIRGFDAQSTSRLYVRVDRNKSYLLYGDYTTQPDGMVRRLSAYSRSLTGAKYHYDDGRVEANVFASRDSTRQVIDEIRANGTSGPYALSSAAGRINSEKVEILVRDRDQPSIVLSSTGQARFYDYEVEPLTGRILFKAPVPSVDPDLNPVTIRVTYEVDQGGGQFWVFGGDVQAKVTDAITLGASYAEDRNPADPFRLAGAHAVVRLGTSTTVAAEYARTERSLTVGQGDAARVAIRHETERLKAEAFAARTDPSFDNPGAYLSQGRGEAGARAAYKLDERTTVKAEALRTEDTRNGNVRDGYMASVERVVSDKLKVEAGIRHAREVGGPAIPPSAATEGSAATVPDEVTSVRARVTTPVPGIANASVYGEVEVDVQDAERKVVALGGDYALSDKGKVYFRHELISSLTGPYGLNEQQRQNTTIVGIDTEYMQDARAFSEYRIRDAVSGGDAEAAIGLRNLWTLAPGLRLGTSLERVHALSGAGQNENTAVALALEYVANPMWKGSTRIELRDGASQQSLLHTVGFAARVSREWTALARNTLSIQRNKGGERDGGERLLERLQAGIAYRDADTDRVNALARVEHREERDDTQAGIELKRSTQLVSIHGDYKLNRPFTVTGRYAAKWTSERSNGITSKYRAQMAGGRLTWEFAPRWDVGLAASGLFGEGGKARQYALGVEVGYLAATNLWVSAGYNVLGYSDDDLAAGEYTRKGAYVRVRYKFDEAAFGALAEGPK